MTSKYRVAWCGLFALLAGCTAPPTGNDTTPAPSADVTAATGPGMVVTSNPLATEAGLECLKRGGSAIDAAIAIEAVLSLVEPQSSGLAGGAYLTYFNAETKRVEIYDGRETAPATATSDMFLNGDGAPMGFLEAKTSGLSTGVPGAVAMLSMAHGDHGRLAWASLFARARTLASEGFPISPRLHGMLTRFGRFIPAKLEDGPTDAHKYFFDDQGQPHPVGYLLKNPDYVVALDMIAQNPKDFYRGPFAEAIVDMVAQPPRAGRLTTADIEQYQALKREPVCAEYRQNKMCGPPPSSSWLAVAQIMGLLEASPGFFAGGAEDWRNCLRRSR